MLLIGLMMCHTAGGSAASAVNHWASTPERVATAFIIERDGTIYNTFDPACWAYHLGLRGYTSLEKASIGIELVAFGNLTHDNLAGFRAWTGRKIDIKEVEIKEYRKEKYFHSYTGKQLTSLKNLITHLCIIYQIPHTVYVGRIFDYNNPGTLPAGIWSHSSVRADKVDCFPQWNIYNALLPS